MFAHTHKPRDSGFAVPQLFTVRYSLVSHDAMEVSLEH